MGVVQKRFCPDCGKKYERTARQLMHDMINLHPVKNVGLTRSKTRIAIMAFTSGVQSNKRSYINPFNGHGQEARQKLGVSSTTSIGSSKLHQVSWNISMELVTAENLASGLDNGFLFRVYNKFQGLSHPLMIGNLCSGYLQNSDLTFWSQRLKLKCRSWLRHLSSPTHSLTSFTNNCLILV